MVLFNLLNKSVIGYEDKSEEILKNKKRKYKDQIENKFGQYFFVIRIKYTNVC